jgi:four helix bundle protein
MAAIKSHRELEVYQAALRGALAVSRLVRRLPKHELKLGDQALRSARSPGSSISEAWRKRRYAPQWISKLSDAESESAETQWWLEIFLNEGYCTPGVDGDPHEQMDYSSESQVAKLFRMFACSHARMLALILSSYRHRRRVSPQPFQLIEITRGGMKNVNHKIDVVDQHPAA